MFYIFKILNEVKLWKKVNPNAENKLKQTNLPKISNIATSEKNPFTINSEWSSTL